MKKALVGSVLIALALTTIMRSALAAQTAAKAPAKPAAKDRDVVPFSLLIYMCLVVLQDLRHY